MAGKISGIDQILVRWRDEIKKKQRRIISFEETVEIKINSIRGWIYPETVPLDDWEFRQFRYTRKRERIFVDKSWKPIKVGQTWGGPDMSAMFRCKARMPAHFRGKKVVLKIYFGGDGLLFLNGKPHQGLDPFRDTAFLAERATGREVYDLQAESYIFWHFGESEVKTLECSHFAVMDKEISDTYWDFRAVYNVMIMQNQPAELLDFLKGGMAKAIAFIDQNETDPVKFRENALKARRVLRSEIYNTDRFKKDGLLHLCGNSHLDVVFLWTHAEFVRKLGRTHASTLRLMEEYPDYIFSQSQPLMYQEMKQNYPTMYREVKKRIKDRRWEVIGAFWVEPDCNLISGESFVRQILYGVRFAEKEFGITPRTCWCPDVFGNAWTMPQILVRSGLKYFVTHKMGVWNDTNPWTKNTFWWQGPDGSRILSVMPPTHFIGTVEPDHMGQHWEKFSDKSAIGESLYNYGWGDGGGGPDPEMLEYLKRYRDFPGVTPAKPGFIEDALERIRAKAVKTDIPVWCDELYLEEHRGVHTTKARLKKLNRYCENLYRDAEIFSCFSHIPYPSKTLESGWKDVLNNQFHDSLPGSHITPVYHDLLDAYERAVKQGEDVRSKALNAIVRRVDTSGNGRAVVVFNSLPFQRNSVASVNHERSDVHVLDPEGNQVPHQFITHYETGESQLIFMASGIPSVGYKTYRIVKGKGPERFDKVTATAGMMENDLVRVMINGEGEITSLVEKKTGRECIDRKGRGNVLMLYEDVPGKYEAWDIAPSYTDKSFDISGATARVTECGPVRSAITVSRRFRNSMLKQRIVLYRDSARIDFETWVDWKEQQKLLKTRFFTGITAPSATYDLPYGTISRSTSRSNSFEEAKFEVPAHWWMDISQVDRGVSLLNNCKYGHEALGGMMALTLLRGPLVPDPKSDQEEHWFTYSIYPHAGSWREGGTMEQAWDLNVPVQTVPAPNHAGVLSSSGSFLSLGGTPVTLEAVKKAEDSADIVIRVVERNGAEGDVEIGLASGIKTAKECNLMEREEKPVAYSATGIRFRVKPYEIRTFKCRV